MGVGPLAGGGEWRHLREEALDLARARDGELVVLGELVHPEDGDDVLERLVVLEHLLDRDGGVVVLVPDDARREDARLRVERVDCKGGRGGGGERWSLAGRGRGGLAPWEVEEVGGAAAGGGGAPAG